MNLKSMVCKYSDFLTPWYREQEGKLCIRALYTWHSAADFDFINRKFWEWCAISKVLDERAMLDTGKSGLGFAVGTEPLPAYFASRGCKILATDLAPESSAEWIKTVQHAGEKAALFRPELVDRVIFDEVVSFEFVDMKTLKGLSISDEFDFLWSSCAFEHLGSLEAGLEFVMKSAELLKPGGTAVHTTEFNLYSNNETLDSGPSVIYRRRDIEALCADLNQRGYVVDEPDYDAGTHPYDVDYDTEPYMTSGKPHIKLRLGEHICTSLLIVIHRP